MGILEDDGIKSKSMREKPSKEYFRRMKKSKLNSRNTIHAINTWAVSLVRYGAGVVDWS